MHRCKSPGLYAPRTARLVLDIPADRRRLWQPGDPHLGADIWAVFQDEYRPNPENPWGRVQVKTGQSTTDTDGVDTLTVEATVDGEDTVLTGSGNGPISAFFDAHAYSTSQLLPTVVLGTVPLLVVFLVLQRHIVAGITAGVSKG